MQCSGLVRESASRKLRMIMASATPPAVRPAPTRWRRWGQLALSLLLFYLGLLALLWWKQEFLLFRPQSLPTACEFARGPGGLNRSDARSVCAEFDNAQTTRESGRSLQCLQRLGGKWKAFHQHSCKPSSKN